MNEYYVNKDSNGKYNVHLENCKYIHQIESNKINYIGLHPTCHGAIIRARKTFPNADGCYYCCEPCHNI